MNATLELGPDGLRLIPGEHELREPAFECFAPGIPRPQGSKSLTGNGGMRESSKYVKAWRYAVKLSAQQALRTASRSSGMGHALPGDGLLLDGPLVLGAEFLFPRPKKGHTMRCPWRKCHSRTAPMKNCAICKDRRKVLRPDAPVYVTGTPDTSKLIRAVEDSLTDADVWTDDSRVVGYAGFPVTCKRYANLGEEPGVWLRVWRVA